MGLCESDSKKLVLMVARMPLTLHDSEMEMNSGGNGWGGCLRAGGSENNTTEGI